MAISSHLLSFYDFFNHFTSFQFIWSAEKKERKRKKDLRTLISWDIAREHKLDMVGASNLKLIDANSQQMAIEGISLMWVSTTSPNKEIDTCDCVELPPTG